MKRAFGRLGFALVAAALAGDYAPAQPTTLPSYGAALGWYQQNTRVVLENSRRYFEPILNANELRVARDID
jgi:hypothetical protein